MIQISVPTFLTSKLVRTKGHILSDISDSSEKTTQDGQQFRQACKGSRCLRVNDLTYRHPVTKCNISPLEKSKLPGFKRHKRIGSKFNINFISKSQDKDVSAQKNVAKFALSLTPSSQPMAPGIPNQQTRVFERSAEKRYSLSLPLPAIQEEYPNEDSNSMTAFQTLPFSTPLLISPKIGSTNFRYSYSSVLAPSLLSIDGPWCSITSKALNLHCLGDSTFNSRQCTWLPSAVEKKVETSDEINQVAIDDHETSAPTLKAPNPNNLMSAKIMPHLSSPQPFMFKHKPN